jgi:uncharacterized glyoxalase superfamily metalloenzyme YdcJ
MFAVMGMYPVSYYDLSQAGVPVHSTAFRPIDDARYRATRFGYSPRYYGSDNRKRRAVKKNPADLYETRYFHSPLSELLDGF